MIAQISGERRLLIVVHSVRGERIRLISARSATKMKDATTKKAPTKRRTSEMRAEYDFSAWRAGQIRGGIPHRDKCSAS